MTATIFQEYTPILIKNPLFFNIPVSALDNLLSCLSTGISIFQKGDTIFESQKKIEKIGIVLEGNIQIVQDDFYGNRSLMELLEPGDLFGESFAFSLMPFATIRVLSVTQTKILFLDPKKIETPCDNYCDLHQNLIHNMLQIVSMKNVLLVEKIEVLSRRSLRDKILAYLSILASKNKSNHILLPFDRQGFADFLCVDRSALSAELSKLQKEGKLQYKKNDFHLILPETSW